MSLINVKCPECKHEIYIDEDKLNCCILTCNCYGGEDGSSITVISKKVAEHLNNTIRKDLLKQMKEILCEEEYIEYEKNSLYKEYDQLPEHMTILMADSLKEKGIIMTSFIIKKNENDEYIAEKHNFAMNY